MENSAVLETTGLSPSTSMALDRTSLAHERTLMAWVRTATSLITFGFTIYKFFEYLAEKGVRREGLIGPRGFGLSMIGLGLFTLLLATIGHRGRIKAMRKKYGEIQYSLAEVLAAVISVFGLLAFFVVIFRQ